MYSEGEEQQAMDEPPKMYFSGDFLSKQAVYCSLLEHLMEEQAAESVIGPRRAGSFGRDEENFTGRRAGAHRLELRASSFAVKGGFQLKSRNADCPGMSSRLGLTPWTT